jgi:trimethylamine---corrinoid protein Co-methyltransferase
MQPKLELLSEHIVERALGEALQLMMDPGVKLQSAEARQILAEAGAAIDEIAEVVRIPEKIALSALETVPHQFFLHNQAGEPVVQYGGDAVHFDPGSSGVHILDPITLEHRSAASP